MIRLHGVSVSRGGRQVVPPLDLAVRPGEVTVVVGPNGAGKSSLLLAMAGQIDCHGTIELDGRPLADYGIEERARLIGWQAALPPAEFGLTVRQRLELAMIGDADIDGACRALELLPLLTRDMAQLSSGERQRLELAAVLARDCPLWLLDEPTAHLDLRHQVSWLAEVRAAARRGRAVVTVLHDLHQTAAVADRVVLLPRSGAALAGDARLLLQRELLHDLFGVALEQFTGERGQQVLLSKLEVANDEDA